MTAMQKCRRVVNHSTPAPVTQLSNSHDFGSLFFFFPLLFLRYKNPKVFPPFSF